MYKIFFSILLLFLINCASVYQNRKLAYRTNKSAFYTIEKKEFDDSSLFSTPFIHPYKIEANKLEDIVGNLRFRKITRIGELRDYVFHPEELTNLAKDIKQVLANLKENECIQIISMYDHTSSVISNYKRTTMLLWIDNDGLNLVFGQIQSEVSKDAGKSFFDWTQIPSINLKQEPDENEIEEETNPYYTFKQVGGYLNKKWLQFSLSDLSKYKLKERRILNPSRKED